MKAVAFQTRLKFSEYVKFQWNSHQIKATLPGALSELVISAN